MRLRGWFIEGYGVFHNAEVRGVPRGLSVFLGPNESGKSTLLAFLIGVLFGFERRRGRGYPYPPLRGGRHGGRVFIEGESGELTVEREAGRKGGPRIFLPDGREGSERDLAEELGGADRGLFQRVFAFDLAELHELQSLQEEGIRQRIFSAAIAGAGRSARDVVAKLTQCQDRLLRPRKSTPINDFLDGLEERRTELTRAREAAERYPALVAEEERRCMEVTRLTEDVTALETWRDTAQRLLDLWSTWNELAVARAELASLQPVDEFPLDPRERLSSILADFSAATKRHEELIRERDGQIQQKAELQARLDPALPPLAGRVAEHFRMLEVHRDRLEQLPAARLKVEQAEEAVRKKLADLGPDWREDRLEGIDLSVARQEEVRSSDRDLQQARTAGRDSRAALESFAKQRQKAERDCDRAAAALEEFEPPDPVLLDRQEQAIRRLRANLNELKSVEAKREARDAVVKDRNRAIQDVDAAAPVVVPAWAAPAVVVAAVACAAGAVYSLVKQTITFDLDLALLCPILLVIAYWLMRSRKRASGGRYELRLKTLRAELAEAEAEGEALRQEAEDLRSAVAEDAKILGIVSTATFSAVEECDARVDKERALRLQWEDLRARLQEAEAGLKEASEEEERLEVACQDAERAAGNVESRWITWKQGAHVPESLEPQGVLHFFSEVQAARELVRVRNEARQYVHSIEQEIAAWEQGARELLEAAGRPQGSEASGEVLAVALSELQASCREDARRREQLALLERTLHETGVKVEAEQGRVSEAAAARDSLFAEAGAGDEAAFRARLEIYEKRRDVKRRIEDRENQIVAQIGRDEKAEKIRDQLATGQVEAWREEVREAERGLEEIGERRDEAIRRHSDAQRTREELEASADTARLEAEIEALREELTQAIAQWRVAAIARGLVEETLGAFTRTRQPAVLAEASTAFAQVTGGYYEQVVQGDGESLQIVNCHGATLLPDELSRGTAEQLYLCLRLGLAAEFARQSTVLPLVMDDVLVNFDPERARAIAELLLDVAGTHQILLFTCHPETAALLTGLEPETAIFRLDRREGSIIVPEPAKPSPEALRPD